jgi:hypothetical protein
VSAVLTIGAKPAATGDERCRDRGTKSPWESEGGSAGDSNSSRKRLMEPNNAAAGWEKARADLRRHGCWPVGTAAFVLGGKCWTGKTKGDFDGNRHG